MGNLNLQALLDQILGMVQETVNLKNKKLAEGLSGHEQTQQRNYEIQKEQNKSTAAQELAGITESGARARQLLASQSAANVAEITGKAHLMGEKEKAEATRYSADKTLEAHKKLIHPEQIKGWTAILADVTSPEADKATARANLFKEYNTDRLGSPKAFDDGQDVIPANPNPTIKPIKTIGSPIPASPAPVTTKTGGAESMEFRSGLSPEEKKNAKERSTKNLLYGTKPQNRGWLDSLFN